MAFITAKGTITRIFHNGKGAELTETWNGKDGKPMSKRWTCWFEQPHGLSEGAEVEINGVHGDQVDEWTDKEQQTRHTVKRAINKARVNGDRPAPAADEPWAASAGGYSDPTPF